MPQRPAESNDDLPNTPAKQPGGNGMPEFMDDQHRHPEQDVEDDAQFLRRILIENSRQEKERDNQSEQVEIRASLCVIRRRPAGILSSVNIAGLCRTALTVSVYLFQHLWTKSVKHI